MKIVQVNVVYGTGSTGRIVECLHHQYESLGHESYVLFGRGPKPDDQHIKRTGYLWEAKLWRFLQIFTGNLLSGSPLGTWRLERAIKSINPDVVHMHCINGNMCDVFSLVRWLNESHFKVVITHHAKYMFTGGCGINLCNKYVSGCGECPFKSEVFGRIARDKSKSIYKNLNSLPLDSDNFIHTFVSPWLMRQGTASQILGRSDCRTVPNPLDISDFATAVPFVLDGNKQYVFFPSSVHGSCVKGHQWLKPLSQLLAPKNISVLVTDEQPASPIGGVHYLGHLSKGDMGRYYKGAIATIVLSSVESFSMPVIESLCCGTPVVAFRCGGPESIETMGYAKFVDYGDVDALVREILKIKEESSPVPSDKIGAIYAPERIVQQYIDIYNDLLRKA